jgi:hypothetical protein
MAHLFDPFGWVSPLSTRVKLLMQESWTLKLTWDQPLPEKLFRRFEAFQEDIAQLAYVCVPRYVLQFPSSSLRQISIHAYADASEKAYGAVVYVRIETEEKVKSHLLIAKGRVAPLKNHLTIPRLELCACLVAARLVKHLRDRVFGDHNPRCFGWTDSMVALGWIQEDPLVWKQFIANRVREIQQLTPDMRWQHCPGETNPADLVSRGCRISTLLESDLWWEGPRWLCASSTSWPHAGESLEPGVSLPQEERKKITVQSNVGTVTHPSPTLGESLNPANFSSYHHLKRVTAWVLRAARRFIDFLDPAFRAQWKRAKPKLNSRQSRSREPVSLDAEELRSAELFWVRDAQKQTYSDEFERLKAGRTLPSTSRLLLLHPQWDSENMIMVSAGRHDRDTRLALLPSSDLALLILRDHHERVVCHFGTEAVLTSIRQKFWIIGGRRLARKVVRDCRVCRRFKVRCYPQTESALPTERCNEAKPFLITGADFAGPLYVREGKAYILLLSCAVTRALHLELVKDMTTEEFLLAIRRFVSLRSACRTIICDNALTFKKAALIIRDISFRFIPERSPWWGGFYERMVRSVKDALKKSLGKSFLSFRELETVLKEIACAINHRPLTVVSTEPEEEEPLTPAHFLDGSPPNTLLQVPGESAFLQEPFLLPALQNRQRLLQRAWQRWKTEYLQSLHCWRTKPGAPDASKLAPRVGDVVIIEDEGKNRKLWPLARVCEVIRGKDGIIRAVRV